MKIVTYNTAIGPKTGVVDDEKVIDLDMQLLPDYQVYDGGEMLEWGFWGNDWQPQGS